MDKKVETNYGNDLSPANDTINSGSNYVSRLNDSQEEIQSYDSSRPSSGKAAKVATISLTSISAVLVVVGGSSLLGPSLVKDSTVVKIVGVEATDKAVHYGLELQNNSSATKTVTLSNDYTLRTEEIILEGPPEISGEDGEETYYFGGSFYGLTSDMNYTLEVKAGHTVLSRQKVRTLKSSNFPKPQLRDVAIVQSSGNLFFTLDVSDESNYWTDYVATLQDTEGNISSVEISDLSLEYNLTIAGYIFTPTALFTITCNSYEPDEEGRHPDTPQRKTIYEIEINIEGE